MRRPSATLHSFDDAVARRWEPMALTRPVAELLFGTLRLRERAARALGLPSGPTLVDGALEGFEEPGAAPVTRREALPTDRFRVLLLGRAVLEAPPAGDWLDSRGASLVVEDRVVGWVLPPGRPLPEPHGLLHPEPLPSPAPTLRLSGTVLEHPWELVQRNAHRVALDLADAGAPPDTLPPGVHRIGRHSLLLGDGVEVEPGVVLDLREGPIRLEDGVRVRAFTRLEGPSWIGSGTIVQGGVVAHVSVGPRCRLHGEVEASVVQGYSNKAHDGFLGHAWLGTWVNLGAMTTNSDLKNNYGPVRLLTAAGEVDTGLLKVGCLLGDHVKTGIGTLLNTGTVVGAGSNLFGGAMPPRRVPAFSWGSGTELSTYRFDRFLEAAERAMGRREVELTPGMRELLRRAFEATRGERGEAGGGGAGSPGEGGTPTDPPNPSPGEAQ